MMNDPIANALSKIINAEKIGKKECIVKPTSKIIKKILDIMKDNHYIGEYEETEDKKGNYLKVNLLGSINKCGVIKPRYNFTKDNLQKFEKRYLPAKDFGLLIVTTAKGITTHIDSKNKNTGGRLLAYIY